MLLACSRRQHMRKNKLPEFTLLLEQFFTEYMPFSSGFHPIPSAPISIPSGSCFSIFIRFRRRMPMKSCSGTWIMRRLTDFLKWIETERGCSASTRNLRLSALASFSFYAQNRNFEAATVFANAVRRIPVRRTPVKKGSYPTKNYLFPWWSLSPASPSQSPKTSGIPGTGAFKTWCTPVEQGHRKSVTLRLETFL